MAIKTPRKNHERPVAEPGTLLPELLPRMVALLEQLDRQRCTQIVGLYRDDYYEAVEVGGCAHPFWDGIDSRDMLEDLTRALHDQAPAGYYFGIKDYRYGFWRQQHELEV